MVPFWVSKFLLFVILSWVVCGFFVLATPHSLWDLSPPSRDPTLPQWKRRALTTGLPGKSPFLNFNPSLLTSCDSDLFFHMLYYFLKSVKLTLNDHIAVFNSLMGTSLACFTVYINFIYSVPFFSFNSFICGLIWLLSHCSFLQMVASPQLWEPNSHFPPSWLWGALFSMLGSATSLGPPPLSPPFCFQRIPELACCTLHPQ